MGFAGPFFGVQRSQDSKKGFKIIQIWYRKNRQNRKKQKKCGLHLTYLTAPKTTERTQSTSCPKPAPHFMQRHFCTSINPQKNTKNSLLHKRQPKHGHLRSRDLESLLPWRKLHVRRSFGRVVFEPRLPSSQRSRALANSGPSQESRHIPSFPGKWPEFQLNVSCIK